MGMVEVKADELAGAALDWAVAKAENIQVGAAGYSAAGVVFQPSADWSQAGPLIDKYGIFFMPYGRMIMATCAQQPAAMGETRLIAACRLIASAALGDVVPVPAELLVTA